jgi:hypothetical protein
MPTAPSVEGVLLFTALAALVGSLDKPFPWAVGFFFGNTELAMELWPIISGISGFDVGGSKWMISPLYGVRLLDL